LKGGWKVVKILYEHRDGTMVAADVVSILAIQNPDDDRWRVVVWCAGNCNPDTVADNLTEKEAKNIVRKLFDYGVYTGV
jgi:hypothetical protein